MFGQEVSRRAEVTKISPRDRIKLLLTPSLSAQKYRFPSPGTQKVTSTGHNTNLRDSHEYKQIQVGGEQSLAGGFIENRLIEAFSIVCYDIANRSRNNLYTLGCSSNLSCVRDTPAQCVF